MLHLGPLGDAADAPGHIFQSNGASKKVAEAAAASKAVAELDSALATFRQPKRIVPLSEAVVTILSPKVCTTRSYEVSPVGRATCGSHSVSDRSLFGPHQAVSKCGGSTCHRSEEWSSCKISMDHHSLPICCDLSAVHMFHDAGLTCAWIGCPSATACSLCMYTRRSGPAHRGVLSQLDRPLQASPDLSWYDSACPVPSSQDLAGSFMAWHFYLPIVTTLMTTSLFSCFNFRLLRGTPRSPPTC